MVAGASSEGICLLEFSDRRMLEAQFDRIRRRFAIPMVPGDSDHLQQLRAELTEYFAGARREFTAAAGLPRHRIRATSLERTARHSLRRDALLSRFSAHLGTTGSLASRRPRQRHEPHRDPDPLPSRRESKRGLGRIRRRPMAQTNPAGTGKRKRSLIPRRLNPKGRGLKPLFRFCRS